MTATITYRIDHIINSKAKAPLYYCPPGQCNPMPALITLDQSGEVYAYHRQCDGTPEAEWSGRTLTWRVDPQVSGKWLAEWLQEPETRAALQCIHDKHVAGEDCYDAATEFENQLKRAQEYAPMVEIWKAFDWIENEDLESLIEAGSIRAWAEEIENNIPDDVQLDGGIVDAIIEKIEYLTDDDDADDEEQEEYFRKLKNLMRDHKQAA